jgi:hypothetical protein
MRMQTSRRGRCSRGRRIQEKMAAWRGRHNDMFMWDEARANRQSFCRHAHPFDLLNTPDVQQLDHIPLLSSPAHHVGTISSSSTPHTPLLLLKGRGRETKTSWHSQMRRSFTTETRVAGITWVFDGISPLLGQWNRPDYLRGV